SGQATFYNTGLGSCGVESHDTDFICAIAAPRYDAQGTANPNNNPLCGKKINVSYNGGPSVTVTIRDRCPECAENNLDLSPAAFQAMGATPDQGRVNVVWSFA
ncbi:plant expansin, partial [Tuber borchii]